MPMAAPDTATAAAITLDIGSPPFDLLNTRIPMWGQTSLASSEISTPASALDTGQLALACSASSLNLA